MSHQLAKYEAARAYLAKLTGLDLTVKTFAHDIEMPEPTVVAWFRGTRPMPKVIRLLIDTLARNARLEAGTTHPNGARRKR